MLTHTTLGGAVGDLSSRRRPTFIPAWQRRRHFFPVLRGDLQLRRKELSVLRTGAASAVWPPLRFVIDRISIALRLTSLAPARLPSTVTLDNRADAAQSDDFVGGRWPAPVGAFWTRSRHRRQEFGRLDPHVGCLLVAWTRAVFPVSIL